MGCSCSNRRSRSRNGVPSRSTRRLSRLSPGEPLGGIVEAFDEAEAGHACLDLRGKAAALEQFAFEGGKEALAQGVIVSVPYRAHREPHAGFLAALAESRRGILAAPASAHRR